MMRTCLVVVLLSCLAAPTVQAEQTPRSAAPSAAMRKRMKKHNQAQREADRFRSAKKEASRPFAEYETAGWVIMSASDSWESKEVKRQIAKNLPDGVKLLILTTEDSIGESSVRAFFKPYIDDARLEVLHIPTWNWGFWARDNVPVPVFDMTGALAVVDAKYFYDYEPDEQVAEYFDAGLIQHDYYYEGGNFLSDHNGNCFYVGEGPSSSTFSDKYGCTTTTKLAHAGGIGHVDEHLKFLAANVAVTDYKPYKTLLEGKGYTVHLLPQPAGAYETYVNSLLVNGTVFVPTYGQQTDTEALEVYESLGFKAVGIDTEGMSNDGLGSIHCITMTYPQVSAAALRSLLRDR